MAIPADLQHSMTSGGQQDSVKEWQLARSQQHRGTYSPSGAAWEPWELPQPLELQEVWLCVPQTLRRFQRYRLCVDKLGLTLRPLVSAQELPKDGPTSNSESDDSWMRGAVPLQTQGGGQSGDFVMMTQTITLPTSSVAGILDDCEEALTHFKSLTAPENKRRGSPLEGPFFRTPVGQLAASRPSESSPQQDVPSDSNASVSSSTKGTRWSGASGEWRADRGDKPGSGFSVEPPYSHMVGLQIKGALASFNARGLERRSRAPSGRAQDGSREKGAAAAPALIYVALCCALPQECQALVASIRRFRRYALSLIFWPLVEPPATNQAKASAPGLTARPLEDDTSSYIEREAIEWGLNAKEVDAVLTALAPPPPKDPNLGKRIPQMTVNEEGQVFWHVAAHKKTLPQRKVNLFRWHSMD